MERWLGDVFSFFINSLKYFQSLRSAHSLDCPIDDLFIFARFSKASAGYGL
jgi:hypothetical protein